MKNTLTLLLVLATLPGCGKELMAGGFRDVEVVATDRPSGASTASQSVVPSRTAATAPALATSIDGTIGFTARAFLVRPTGTSIAISQEPVAANLRIAASETASLGRRTVPSESYVVLRIDFDDVEAEVAVEIGGVMTTISLGIGGPISIDQDVVLTQGSREEAVLEVNLNATSWALPTLTEAQRRAAFAAAVEVRVL